MPTPSPNPSETPASPSESKAPKLGLPIQVSSYSAPFLGLAADLNLNEDLEIVRVDIGDETREQYTRKMLKAVDDDKNYLPGQPRVRLDEDPDGRKDTLLNYLNESHNTRALDDLLPYMRYIFTQTPSYKHTMALNHQRAHAREIKVTEHSGLHLVFYYETIFVKPVPAYFYSPAFWEYLEDADVYLYWACIGFMRSYYMLIKYKLDFDDACQLRLIPEKGNGQMPTYEEWCRFIAPFARVGDEHVSLRYHYGELRLTRINRAAMLFRSRLAYFNYRIYPEWGSFMEHSLAPVVTMFAVCAVVLNSMQVGLAAITMVQTPPDAQWLGFVSLRLVSGLGPRRHRVSSCLCALRPRHTGP